MSQELCQQMCLSRREDPATAVCTKMVISSWERSLTGTVRDRKLPQNQFFY